MTSYGNPPATAVPRPGQQAAYGMPVHAPSGPVGTFSPGTKIQVGGHRVVIQKYLSEGGFAHVYLVKLPRPIDGTDQAVLKRVAVPDKEALRGMRTEVETMKRLKGHRQIVTYMDSHASELKGGGYEVFLLMEYCNGGGLIDFMNTRLQHRLTEPEILNIFTDVAEGVACMHYLKPALLHRDLKVENVLITMNGSKRVFKLCDFGSSAPPKPAPTTVVECRLMDEDVQKHTTLQYRSPEMIDVYRKQPINEKSDIWALGVLLYKLCYYTTPFEDQGQLAILNASYRFPSHPIFSDRLKQLIASMLRENLKSRPTIYQVLREGCLMQGREVPIQDIYSARAHSEPRPVDRTPIPDQRGKSTPVVGAVFAPPPPQQQAIPDVVPMRRGRPPATSSQPAQSAQKPSPSPMRVTNGDPFAALDSKTGNKQDSDELSSRFPTLDEFALLHDQGTKFDFEGQTSPPAQPRDLSQRVTAKLADDAFARPQGAPTPGVKPRQSADLSRVKSAASTMDLQQASSSPVSTISKPASAPPKPTSSKEMSRASAIISNNPELQAISSAGSTSTQPASARPGMVSTGTMTSTPPPADFKPREYPPIYRFPPSDQKRSKSANRQAEPTPGQLRPDPNLSSRPLSSVRASSYASQSGHIHQPSSSRPSLEGGRPNQDNLEPQARQTLPSRPRPTSNYLESNLDYLRERETAPKPSRSPGLGPKASSPATLPTDPEDDVGIESNVDFLRSMEESDSKKPKNQSKRSSLGALAGTKNILAGKFGDAFKRFEAGNSQSSSRTPPPLKDTERRDLTPIAGSEATDGRSDDGRYPDDPEEMTPEMRRELEARSLAEEERRVEAAAAEYRQRMAARGAGGPTPLPRSIGGVSRATSIQNRVQNLLDESQKSGSNVHKTAEGYGHFSDAATASARLDKELPDLPRKPVGGGGSRGIPARPATSSSDALARIRPVASMPTDPSAGRVVSPVKPNAPRKPQHLNSLPTGGLPRSPPKQQQPRPPVPSEKPEQLVGVGLPGRPTLDMTSQEKEDYISDFSKRFPSLGSIEMVERDIDAELGRSSGR